MSLARDYKRREKMRKNKRFSVGNIAHPKAQKVFYLTKAEGAKK
jgi:hypothetical protein